MIKSRRLGKLVIHEALIDSNPDAARAVMGELIVLEAGYSVYDNCIHYVAISERFDNVELGAVIPEYIGSIQRTAYDSYRIEFNKRVRETSTDFNSIPRDTSQHAK